MKGNRDGFGEGCLLEGDCLGNAVADTGGDQNEVGKGSLSPEVGGGDSQDLPVLTEVDAS